MMGPEVDMSEKAMVSVKESVIKLPEEELLVCASNCEDRLVLPVTIKETVNTIVKLPEKEFVVCASNQEDHDFVHTVPKTSLENLVMPDQDVEVDVVENVVPHQETQTLVQTESLDATDNSSSFGGTHSGTQTTGPASDVEVESQVPDDNGAFIDFDGFNDLFITRKKKLTSHWRKYVRRLTWRCKWLELHIREFRSQASKYDRELAECSRRKQCELDKCTDGNPAVKAIPSVYQNQSGRIMKRRKRKRVEDTVDLASYSSSHCLFSYFASKRACGDSAYFDDEHGNTEKTSGRFAVNGDWSFLEFKDSDAFEDILRNIEVAQLHVRQLKTRIDTIIRETAERYIPVNASLAPREPLESCGPSSNIANGDGENVQMGSIPTTSQQQELVLLDSGVSGEGKLKPLPDMIGATDRPGKCDKTENGIHIQSVKEELNEEPVDLDLDPNSPSKMSVNRDQDVKILSKLNTTPKIKKRRGKRKARASRWSKRSSG